MFRWLLTIHTFTSLSTPMFSRPPLTCSLSRLVKPAIIFYSQLPPVCVRKIPLITSNISLSILGKLLMILGCRAWRVGNRTFVTLRIESVCFLLVHSMTCHGLDHFILCLHARCQVKLTKHVNLRERKDVLWKQRCVPTESVIPAILSFGGRMHKCSISTCSMAARHLILLYSGIFCCKFTIFLK